MRLTLILRLLLAAIVAAAPATAWAWWHGTAVGSPVTINVAGIAGPFPKSVGSNSLSPACFTNPVENVIQNNTWTQGPPVVLTSYLTSPGANRYAVLSQAPCAA